MQLSCDGIDVFHNVTDSFMPLLRRALDGKRIAVALGPIYDEDPAQTLMFPFIRADVETGWSGKPREPDGVPEHILEKARALRQECLDNYMGSGPWWDGTTDEHDMLNHWARAGLVLEIARRRGVNVRGLGRAHNYWKLKGTQTGRFGAVHWGSSHAWPNGFNPLTIPEHSRNLVVPSAGNRLICLMDFKAMDLCSMTALVPGLIERYRDSHDHHGRTAEILFGDNAKYVENARDVCKIEIFVHAYGGDSSFRRLFDEKIPELIGVRKIPNGDFARTVQRNSAEAFRAALSNALPLLLGDDIIPMFTVHDELVLDVGEDHIGACVDLANKLQEGASEWMGVPYFVEPKFGLDYEKAKAA